MFDKQKLDAYFQAPPEDTPPVKLTGEARHTIWVRHVKHLLPGLAAILLGVLLVYPYLFPKVFDIKLKITRPLKGELEKLHITNTTFYINDAQNRVNSFTAQNIDETAPGSKLIKLTNPEGTLPQEAENWLNIKAPVGYYNQQENTLELSSLVNIFYSDGMTVELEKVLYDFKTDTALSKTPVKAEGDMGNLDAAGFIFYKNEGILIFSGPAHIVIKEETLRGNKK